MDKLFADEDSTIEDVDFDTILGPTVDGEWQPEEENKEAQVRIKEEEVSYYHSMFFFCF